MTFNEVLQRLQAAIGTGVMVIIGANDMVIAMLAGVLRKGKETPAFALAAELGGEPDPATPDVTFTVGAPGADPRIVSAFTLSERHFIDASVDGPKLTIQQPGVRISILMRPAGGERPESSEPR